MQEPGISLLFAAFALGMLFGLAMLVAGWAIGGLG